MEQQIEILVSRMTEDEVRQAEADSEPLIDAWLVRLLAIVDEE